MKIKRQFILFALLIITAWITLPFILKEWVYTSVDKRGQWGDQYGSINALFAGSALIGVAIAIYYQQKEIAEQREIQSKQIQQMERQVQLMRASAKLSALPGLIEQEARRHRSMLERPRVTPDDLMLYTVDQIDERIMLVNEQISIYEEARRPVTGSFVKHERNVEQEKLNQSVKLYKGKEVHVSTCFIFESKLRREIAQLERLKYYKEDLNESYRSLSEG